MLKLNKTKYIKCKHNRYENSIGSGWYNLAPITPGKIYEVLGNNNDEYLITPDYKIEFEEIYARIAGEPPNYNYPKNLFIEPTEAEIKIYLRDNKLKKILNF